MPAKVTGYMLRDAIKTQEMVRDTAASAFDASLKAFPGEENLDTKNPTKIVETFMAAETLIAKLQVAQMVYNIHVKVNVLGENMTLGEAIKRVGGIGRTEKMWKGAIQSGRPNIYGDTDTRDPNQVRAERTLPAEQALAFAKVYGKKANALRAAIATANGTEINFTDLDESLFE